MITTKNTKGTKREVVFHSPCPLRLFSQTPLFPLSTFVFFVPFVVK